MEKMSEKEEEEKESIINNIVVRASRDAYKPSDSPSLFATAATSTAAVAKAPLVTGGAAVVKGVKSATNFLNNLFISKEKITL